MPRDVLYVNEIGTAKSRWTDLSPPIIHPFPRGEARADAGPRLARILGRYPTRDFCDPAPRPPPRGTSWAADAGALRLRVAQSRALASRASLLTGPLAAVEAENFEKFSTQLGAAPGWDIITEGLGLEGGADIAEGLELVFGAIAATEGTGRLTPRAGPYPRHSNAGWPSYGSGADDKLALALCAAGARGLDDLNTMLRAVATRHGALDTPHITLFSRSGPTNKTLKAVRSTGTAIEEYATLTGLAPRRRHVFGVPTVYNLVMQRWANAAKDAILTRPEFYHTSRRELLRKVTLAMRRVGQGARIVSDDPSGFDQHIRAHHHSALRRTFWDRWWPTHVCEVWSFVHALPVASTPLAGAGTYLYARNGVETSGIITTTIDDILINAARVLLSAAAGLGVSPRRAADMWLNGEFFFMVWGDDTLLVVPPLFNTEAYKEESERLGFPSRTGSSPVFLMTYLDVARATYFPLASRVWQNTVGRERGADEAIELFGLYMRTWRATENPFFRDVWRALATDSELMERRGVTSREALGALVATPTFREELEVALKARPDVMRELIGAADRGGVSKASIAWLQATFGVDFGASAHMSIDTSGAFAGDAAARQLGLEALEYILTPVSGRGVKPGALQEIGDEGKGEGAEGGGPSEDSVE